MNTVKIMEQKRLAAMFDKRLGLSAFDCAILQKLLESSLKGEPAISSVEILRYVRISLEVENVQRFKFKRVVDALISEGLIQRVPGTSPSLISLTAGASPTIAGFLEARGKLLEQAKEERVRQRYGELILEKASQ